jgi:hypothetical protein
MSESVLYLVHDRRHGCSNAVLRLHDIYSLILFSHHEAIYLFLGGPQCLRKPSTLAQQAVLHLPWVHRGHGNLHVHGLGLYLLVHLDWQVVGHPNSSADES